MAYDKKNTIEYFPHTVSHGRKMFIIRNLYGNDGYTVWFMLLEELGKANNHFLDLSDPTQMMYLTAEFKVSNDKFLNIIQTLIDLKELDQELWQKSRVVYSEKFTESIADAYKRRKNPIIHKSEIYRQHGLNCMQDSEKCSNFEESVDEIQQSKLKESKLKESKEEDNKKIKRFSPPTKEEVFDYMIEKKVQEFTAKKESEKFFNHYESNGWMVGRTKMKKWKSAVSGWITRMNNYNGNNNQPQTSMGAAVKDKMKKYD